MFEDVAVGKDGWLFLSGGSNDAIKFYIDPDHFSIKTVLDWINILETRKKFFLSRNIRYLHMIAPEKISVFPQFYPGELPFFDLHPISRLRHAMGGAGEADLVPDLVPILRVTNDPHPTYFQTDTHWTLWGAIKAFKHTCSLLGFKIDEDFSQRQFAHWPITFDLGGKLRPEREEDTIWLPLPDQIVRVYANDTVLIQENKMPPGADGITHHGSHAIFHNPQARFQETVVLFGDSFSGFLPGTLTALFAEFFANVHFYWSTSVDANYCAEVGATVVVSEIAERFMGLVPKDDLHIAIDTRMLSGKPALGPPSPNQPQMAKITLNATIPMTAATASVPAYTQSARPRRIPPVPVYQGQDMSALIAGMDRFASDPAVDFHTHPAISLDLHEMEDAYFLIENGVDNVVFSRDIRAVQETMWFSSRKRDENGNIDLSLPYNQIDDVFLGFDAGWHNYFHFLVLGLGRSYLADKILPAGTRIVIPDYQSRHGYSQLKYSERTYDQALVLSGLGERVTKLPVGLYHAKKIRFFWPSRNEPTLVTYLDVFDEMFGKIRDGLERSNRFPKRLFIARGQGSDPRLSPEETALVDGIAERHGFSKIFLENHDLLEQAEMFFNAEAVVAPHGAGLGNLLFGTDRLKVLELNRDLDGEGRLRSCFFQVSSLRRQQYSFLNQSNGDFTEENLERAFRRLTG